MKESFEIRHNPAEFFAIFHMLRVALKVKPMDVLWRQIYEGPKIRVKGGKFLEVHKIASAVTGSH
jgi:hypothetical protein